MKNKNNNKNKAGILALAMIIFSMSIGAYIGSRQNNTPQGGSNPKPGGASSMHEPSKPQDPDKNGKVTLYAVGDNLFHQSLIDDGKNMEDYMKFYENIADDIKNADIAFVNQETVIGGESLGHSGYPNFNSPYDVGNALAKLGFDVVSHANNHIMDKGMMGISKTLDFWQNHKNVTVIGMYGSKEERDNIAIVERGGIKFAFLSYTYGLNGYKLPEDKPYTTNLLDLDLMRSDVRRAKEQSDVVVVSTHWGNEYSTVPTANQRNIAQALADAGVDVVLGHHPHVIQPVEVLVGKDGNKMPVYYSLGNLVHSMEVTDCMLGAAAVLEFTRGDDGIVSMSDASIEPLINHYEVGKKGFRVYKLSEYTEALAARHGIKKFDRAMSITDMERICKSVLGKWYNDEGKDWKTILVNPSNLLPSDFDVTLELMSGKEGMPARADMKVDARIAGELLQMFADAKKDGVNLYLRSAHRSYTLQKTYYDSQYTAYINSGLSPEQAKAKTLEYTAYPGASEHHTGLAVDIISVEWENTRQVLVESFDTTQDFAWLRDNAHKYGFILRYHKGKEAITSINYEPWHFRYVGLEAAKEIYEKGICLEEYVLK